MKLFFLATVSLVFSIAVGQNVYNKSVPSSGTIKLTDSVNIPKIKSGFTLWKPETNPEGLIVFFQHRRDTINSNTLIDEGLKKNLAILYVSTDNPMEMLFENDKMIELENHIWEAINLYNLPKNNILFCGMSLGGTRALRMAKFSQSPQSQYKIVPLAIAVCDSPLDMIRFYKEMIRTIRVGFHPVAVNEAEWVSEYLSNNLGGKPENNLTTYEAYSPYCHLTQGGENLDLYKNIAIRAYSEPDVNWWIENRRNDYYSMNVIDLAGFINELKILNNDRAELILTSGKGVRENGNKHPHSWSIVDEADLVQWFLKML